MFEFNVFVYIQQNSNKINIFLAPASKNIQLRLTGGNSTNAGLLQVNYGGKWGTVCDDDFNSTAAKVVCNQLGVQL